MSAPTAAEDEKNFRLAERAFRRKIRAWARLNAYKLPGLAMDASDLEQEAWIALWKAVRTYDPDHGAKFHSWFTQCLNTHFISLLRRTSADCRRIHVDIETLDVDAVAKAIEHKKHQASAEDIYLAPLVIETLSVERRQFAADIFGEIAPGELSA